MSSLLTISVESKEPLNGIYLNYNHSFSREPRLECLNILRTACTFEPALVTKSTAADQHTKSGALL